MSDARAQFLGLDYEPCAVGEEVRFGFACPLHLSRRCEGLMIRAGEYANVHPSWDWTGGHEAPTFSPSINCKGCWHGYIENGRCVNTAHADEPEPTVS